MPRWSENNFGARRHSARRMRCQIVAADVLDRLDQLIAGLRPLARLAWSRASNLHITTKFIGEWPEEKLPQLQRALAAVAARPPIHIRVNGLGFHPHLFFAGVEASRELAVLAEDTSEALAKLNIPPETRPYSPHLTLARIKKRSGLAAFRKEVGRIGQPDFGAFTADRFFLYLSKPGPSGS